MMVWYDRDMKKIFLLSLLSILVSCEKGTTNNTRYCEETFLGFFGYFDDCFTNKYKLSESSTYTGRWKNNKYHGANSMINSSNLIRHGNWIEGKQDGIHGMMILDDYDNVLGMSTTTYSLGYEEFSTDIIWTDHSSNIKFAPDLLGLGEYFLDQNPKPLTREPLMREPLMREPLIREPSYIRTVPVNKACPKLSTPLIREDRKNGNRFCYYQ